MARDEHSPESARKLTDKLLDGAKAVGHFFSDSENLKNLGYGGAAASASFGVYMANHPIVSAAVFGGASVAALLIGFSRYHKRIVKAIKSDVDLRDEKIARSFGELQDKYVEFYGTILLISAKQKTGEAVTPTDWLDAMTAHGAYLHQVCATAALVLTLKRPEFGPFDCNVKYFFVPKGATKSEFHFATVARASSDHHRRADDDRIRRNPELVMENVIYRDLFHRTFRDDHYACADLEARLAKIALYEDVNSPNLHTTPKRYKSMLVHLVAGPAGSMPGAHGRVLLCRNKAVVALMCADSPVVGAFTDTSDPVMNYQVALMRQLTSYVYSSYQTMASIAANLPHADHGPFIPTGL